MKRWRKGVGPNADLPAQDAVPAVGGPFGRQAVDEAAVPAAETPQRAALVGAGQGRVREHRRRGFGRRAGQVRPAAAIMVAAPLTAEATLPHSTRGETAIASTARTIWVMGPASSAVGRGRTRLRRLPPSSARDSRNGPPRAGTQRACATSTGSARPAAAAPRAGDSSRAHSPSCAIEAATRNSTAAAGTPGRRREPLADLADPAGQRVR